MNKLKYIGETKWVSVLIIRQDVVRDESDKRQSYQERASAFVVI